jgi:FAD/FMN-containing dehydrogenase
LSGAYAAAEDNVTSCELMAARAIDSCCAHSRLGRSAGRPARRYVLMEWASTRARREGENARGLREKMEAYLGEAMEKGLVLDAVLAQTEAQSRSLWALRENHSEAQKREGPSIKHDISVAVSRIPAFMTEGLAAMKKALPDCRPVPFGHVGDGNLHFNCQAPAGWDKARFAPHIEKISGAIYDLVVAYGGSISAEHGIGRIKVDELAHYRRGRVEHAYARSALDPQNIMNPGKVVRV